MNILKFKDSPKWNPLWNSLENTIPGIKESIKLIYNKLQDIKFSPVLYKKQRKPIYHLTIKEKTAIKIILVKNQVSIIFYAIKKQHFNYKGANPIIICNLIEFNEVINDWYEQISNYSVSCNGRYIRKQKYSIEEILNKTIIDKQKNDNDLMEFDGDMVHMASDRYKTFLLKGTICISCGLKASYFAKEKDIHTIKEGKTWHFNLYGINEDNEEILFTKDHIIPRSKDGLDTIDNYQTMCTECNNKKGNKL